MNTFRKQVAWYYYSFIFLLIIGAVGLFYYHFPLQGGIAVLLALVFLWPVITIKYILSSDGMLFILKGPFRKIVSVRVKDMISIRETRSVMPWNLNSGKSIRITYPKGFVVLTPKHPVVFIKSLLRINPNIKIESK